MKVISIFRTFLIALIGISVVTCQDEKFTEKSIPEVEITLIKAVDGGTLFEGRILSTGSEAILEHGFLWDTQENPLPDQSSVAFLGPGENKSSFSVTVTSDIEKDRTYYARAFLITENHLSLGSVTTFKGGESIPAVITSVSPTQAVCGDTVVIKGENFSFTPVNNMVLFNNVEAIVLNSGPGELLVKVPPAAEGQVKIAITVSGLRAKNMIDFTVMAPILTGFFPLSGTFGDTITLSGSNFCVDSLYSRVYFNNKRAQIVVMSRDHYKVIVPPENNITPAEIQIKYFNYFSYNEQFTLDQAVIENISSQKVVVGSTLLISGKNFNPASGMTTVEIGGINATVISCSESEMEVLVPTSLDPGNYDFSLTTLPGSPVIWSGTLEIFARWRRLKDFPGEARTGAAGFCANGKGYLVAGKEQSFSLLSDTWEYDPVADQWTEKANFLKQLTIMTGLTLNNTGYVTMGKISSSYNLNLYCYNPVNDSWTTKATKPGSGSSMKSPGFVIDEKAYFTEYFNLYEYNATTDKWNQKSSLPISGYFGGGVAFTIGSKGYFGIGDHIGNGYINSFYEYNPTSDTWTKKADFPGEPRGSATGFSLPNGKGYVGMGFIENGRRYLKDMWEYDPVTNQWTRIEDFPGLERYDPVVFIINSKAYIVTGNSNDVLQKDFWLFDPMAGE